MVDKVSQYMMESEATFDSMSDFISKGADTDQGIVKVTSFYGSWKETTSGPQGSSEWFHTGVTGETQTTNTTSGIIAAMATGLVVDSRGNQWKLFVKDKIFNVKSFGAKGDFSNDDTTAIQAAINAIKAHKLDGSTYGQATLYFPPVDSNDAYLVSDQLLFQDMIQVTITGGQGSHIRNTSTSDPIFHFEGTVGFGNVFGFVVDNIFLSNSYSSNTEATIKLTRCILSWFNKIYIDNSLCGYGIYLDSSSSENWFSDVIIEQAGIDGVYCNGDLNHFTNIHTANCTRYGFNFDSNSRGNVCNGLISYLSGQHGIYCVGLDNQLGNVVVRNNGKTTNNTYDGVYLGGARNSCSSICAYDDQATQSQRYGFNCQGTNNSCLGSIFGTGNVTSLINSSHSSSARFFGDGTTSGQVNGFTINGVIKNANPAFWTDGDSSPDVSTGNKFRANYTSPTNITALDGITNGQSVRLLNLGSTLTLINSSSLSVGGSNLTVGANKWVEFECIGSTVYGWLLN